VVVTDVAEGSAAEAAGIRGGDLILEVNRRPVGSVDEFRKIVGSLKPGESVPVQLHRGGGGGCEYVVLKAPEKP
jgi:serine protease Do